MRNINKVDLIYRGYTIQNIFVDMEKESQRKIL